MFIDSQELYQKLYQHHSVLNESTLNYLCELISLQHSVLEEKEILEERGNILSQLDFYQEILEYNIYHRALGIIDSFNRREQFQIEKIVKKQEFNVTGTIEVGKEFPLFSYDSKKEIEGKPTHLITLYESVRDLKQRELQKGYVLQRLQGLYHRKALTEYNDGENYQLCMRMEQQIAYYENAKKELEEHENSTNEDRQMIQIQEDFCNEFLKDYQIKKEDFEDETSLSQRPCRFQRTCSKRMIKTYPSITVTRDIRCI